MSTCTQCGQECSRITPGICGECSANARGFAAGYRAALAAVKAEIAAMPYIRGIGEVSEDLLARIARLEKEQAK